ncbi:MAG: MFS transporter [Thermoproteota archaeon]|jgi:MFS family permease
MTSSQVVKVTAAATIGTVMEWYDFFLAALLATTVWPLIFFPAFDPVVGTAAALSTYFVVWFSRPIGAYIFGYYGDRIGRKTTLIWTLLLMGISSIIIGITPDYYTIGWVAPAIIILMRLLLGIGLGGEWGGAASWVLEFATKSKYKGFWTSWVNFAIYAGLALGAGLFILFRALDPANFVTVGWRYLFIIGGIMIIIGIIIRYTISESPLFVALKNKGEVDDSPALKVLKIEWKVIMLQASSWAYIITATSGVILAYSVPYLIALEFDPIFPIYTIVIGAISGAIFTIIGGIITDFLGKKSVMIFSIILVIIFSYPYFLLLSTKNITLILLAQSLLFAITALAVGALPKRFGEHFNTKYRYSGAGLSFQIGALLGGIPAIIIPLFAILAGGFLNAWPYVMVTLVVVSLLSLVATIFVKEAERLSAD